MSRPTEHVDRPFLAIIFLLVLIGFFIFSSASLGLLGREGAQFSSVAFSQIVFGIGGGLIALTILANVPYRTYRNLAPYLYGVSIFLLALVFIPGIGYVANGARRWLNVFGHSFQPAEIVKITFILFLAWYFSTYYKKLNDVRFALGGLFAGLAIAGVFLLLQPDTGTFAILAITGGAMALAANVRLKHIAILVALLVMGLGVLALSRPYLLDRVLTFMHPASDPSGSGYQIRQSLIAVGSGGLFGRGFGQSVQKFSYLPEPIGDSIFSVAAEEFGFVGSLCIIGLFLLFAIRGLQIATHAPDRFGGLTVVGIVILIVAQTNMNIGSMVGIMPLTGEPLVFISHGGTSLFFALASVGIILNISRYSLKTQPASI
ncbi:MAG: cell division protein FtsW [Candidatus Pacebacteria bacterium]|nr:cell division protein FtsW [Candidatus Paceibacterota bacterium]